MRNVCDPITTPLEDFDFVVEALLKSARLTVEKVIGDPVEPVIERSQKGIKAFQPAPFDLPDPIGDGARGRLLALLGIKDGAQLFAQLVDPWQPKAQNWAIRIIKTVRTARQTQFRHSHF